MGDWKIDTRDGLEVFLNDAGTISIKQDAAYEDPSLVVVHPDDVDRLIGFLQAARDEARATERGAQ